MRTPGWFGYRYKGIYYREFYKDDAEPSKLGLDSARKIPRDPNEVEGFKRSTIASILGNQPSHMSITDDNSWMIPTNLARWSYLIDFDNGVFTVNGTVHFKLHRMPSRESGAGQGGFVAYFDYNEPSPIPKGRLTTISYWDSVHFDVDGARKLFESFRPTIAPLRAWRAPTWDTLSVAQHLSACLIRTLVADHSEELSLAAFRHIQRQLGLFTWQLTCIAASSNITCPPGSAARTSDVLYLRADLDEFPAYADIRCAPVSDFVQSNGFRNRFSRFRGRLIMFCIRLDEPAYMMYEVGRLAERLSDRGGGIGIAISSWQMVAVVVDGATVRHSPVLDLHDHKKELNDGVLLLMHLLRPIAYPYNSSRLPRSRLAPAALSGCRLPEDVLRRITLLTDYETFLTLPRVSRLFRLIYISQPRVGHCTLLGKIPGSNDIFKVYNGQSSATMLATLTRVKASKNSRYNSNDYKQTQPLWKYTPKRCQREILRFGLARTFQYSQTGSGTLAQFYETAPHAKVSGARYLTFRIIMTGKLPKKLGSTDERSPRLPSLRIQVIDGLWEMIGVGSEKAKWLAGELSKIPDETPPSYHHYGIGDYEGGNGEEEEYDIASGIACYTDGSSDD